MEKALIDSDVLSEILKGRNQNILHNARTYETIWEQFTTSAINVMEIVKGFRLIGKEEEIQKFLVFVERIEVVSFDSAAAETAGRIFADLQKTGQPIGFADSVIAAIVITNQLVLATNNPRHYERIQQLGYPLRLHNWKVL